MLEKAYDQNFTLTLTWSDETAKITDASLNSANVEVLFTAELNEEAVLGAQGNVNTAKLTYSSNANVDENGKQSEKTEDTEEDFVIAFTYKLEISKVDVVDEEALESVTGELLGTDEVLVKNAPLEKRKAKKRKAKKRKAKKRKANKQKAKKRKANKQKANKQKANKQKANKQKVNKQKVNKQKTKKRNTKETEPERDKNRKRTGKGDGTV